jgi:hypothetical protein
VTRMIRLLLAAGLIAAFLAVPTWAQNSGSIFTTAYVNGAWDVNANLLSDPTTVYLDGGPHNTNASGLPPGTYYYQVTDPSGKTLLSLDDISCRQVQVVANAGGNGVIDGAPAGVTCSHPDALSGNLNLDNDGGDPILLWPYAVTPNGGGVYKVWLTPVSQWHSCTIRNGQADPTSGVGTTTDTAGCDGSFGFVPGDTKTDNFKIRCSDTTGPNAGFCGGTPQSLISGIKYLDANTNGVLDTNESGLGNWEIDVTAGQNVTKVFTDQDGNWSLSLPPNTTFTACEILQAGWYQSGPPASLPAGYPTPTGASVATINSVNCWTDTAGGLDLSGFNFGNYQPLDLTVSKTATSSFNRTYNWTITKDVDNTVIDQASGGNAVFNYTVKVNETGFTDSGWQVTGTITVTNPNSLLAFNGVVVTDAVDDGGTCAVTGGTSVNIDPGKSVDLPYTCTYSSAPSPAAGTNTATADWSAAGVSTPHTSGTGQATFDFSSTTPSATNRTIHVTDTFDNGSPTNLGSVTATDTTPYASATYTYSHTVAAPGGTCATHDNTAAITETNQTADKSVRVCGGSDLAVSKTALTAFLRTYNWTISKAVDKTLVEQFGGTATFNYTVKAGETGFADSGWQVSGTITVTNPNDWEDITATAITDTIDNGGTCMVTGGTGVSIPKSGNKQLPYTCTYASAPGSGTTNTATATWNKSAYFTADGSATGTAPYAFTAPTSTANKSITVTDTFNGGTPVTLGTLTATDATPYASATYTYPHTLNVPASACVFYPNTAGITETGQTAGQRVEVCGPANTGALTMGFWQNKNGQAIITGGASTGGICNSGIWLRQFAEFQDLSATAKCAAVATYVTNVIKAANASGTSMNAMLKAQDLATSLDVYFSDPALGGNQISATGAIGGVRIDLTKVCAMADGSGGTANCSGKFENASGAFGGATALTVWQMLAYAASQSNVGGTVWYANLKATQQLAKDAFDAINNGVAFAAP